MFVDWIRTESVMYSTLEEHELPRTGDPSSGSGGTEYTMGGAVGVTRSRTLPSSRRRGTTVQNANPGASNPDLAPVQEKVKGVLLKKQKRASYFSPSTTSTTPNNNYGNMGRSSASHLPRSQHATS